MLQGHVALNGRGIHATIVDRRGSGAGARCGLPDYLKEHASVTWPGCAEC